MGSSLAVRGRLVLAFAVVAAVLSVQRVAEASCGPPSCSVVAVDGNCQAVPSGQPVSGDPLTLQITCTMSCCSGPSNCGQNPYPLTADSFGLKKYESSQGVETLSTEPVSSFSAHASCPDVYVSQACIPRGKYAVLGTDVEVTQGDCADDSGCSVAEPARGGATPLWLLVLLSCVGAFWRRRLS